YTVKQLIKRGLEVRLDTRMNSCLGGKVELSDGETFEADTVVWTAGVRPHPMLDGTDLPRDAKGRVTYLPTLQVIEGDRPLPGAWAAGDCAAVPHLTSDDPDALCSPSAQHAVRQAKRLADNIIAVLRGRAPVPYRHQHAGSVASLGLYNR